MESYSESLCHEMRKLQLEMISQGTLNHISVEPTLHDQIIMAHYMIKVLGSSNKNSLRGTENINASAKITREFYGLKVA